MATLESAAPLLESTAPLVEAPAPAGRRPAVEVAHLRKTYGSLVAVDDVSFTVAEGEIFGILGLRLPRAPLLPLGVRSRGPPRPRMRSSSRPATSGSIHRPYRAPIPGRPGRPGRAARRGCRPCPAGCG